MKIEENLELFNKLKEEFKKKYGTKEIELHPHVQLARRDHDSGGEPYMTKLRINPNNGELEWYKNYWDFGWKPENDPIFQEFGEVALIQVLS